MSERIKQLVEEAGFFLTEKNGASLTSFAWLIVEECASLHNKTSVVDSTAEYKRGRQEMAHDILKHFHVGTTYNIGTKLICNGVNGTIVENVKASW